MTYQCKNDEIFVFGSNLSGIHGKGAALTARQLYGAKLGQGCGLAGYKHGDIAPMFLKFKDLKNVRLPDAWIYLYNAIECDLTNTKT